MTNLLEWLRRNEKINSLLYKLGGPERGLGGLFIRLLYFYCMLFPSKEVRKSNHFFRTHKEEVKKNIKLLADPKSKEVYRNIINFRMTMNYKFHPGMERAQYFPDGIISIGDDEVFVDVGGMMVRPLRILLIIVVVNTII